MSTVELDEIKQRQRTEWNAAAPGWRKWGSRFLPNLQPLADMLIRNAGIKPGDAVLDMATGTGEPALTIAKVVGPKGRVVGLDLSPAMLAVAMERAVAKGLTNVAFHANEHDNLPALQDNSFDAAVCRLGLMFMPDPVRMLESIRRVLKPKGKVSVAVWGPPEKAPFFTTSMKVLAKYVPDIKPVPPGTPGSPFGIPSQEMLGNIFGKAGFSNFNSQTTQVMVIQDASPEEYWETMTESAGPLVALMAKMPVEKRNMIRDDVVQTLRNMFPTGSVRLGGEAIVGTGTKP